MCTLSKVCLCRKKKIVFWFDSIEIWGVKSRVSCSMSVIFRAQLSLEYNIEYANKSEIRSQVWFNARQKKNVHSSLCLLCSYTLTYVFKMTTLTVDGLRSPFLIYNFSVCRIIWIRVIHLICFCSSSFIECDNWLIKNEALQIWNVIEFIQQINNGKKSIYMYISYIYIHFMHSLAWQTKVLIWFLLHIICIWSDFKEYTKKCIVSNALWKKI